MAESSLAILGSKRSKPHDVSLQYWEQPPHTSHVSKSNLRMKLTQQLECAALAFSSGVTSTPCSYSDHQQYSSSCPTARTQIRLKGSSQHIAGPETTQMKSLVKSMMILNHSAFTHGEVSSYMSTPPPQPPIANAAYHDQLRRKHLGTHSSRHVSEMLSLDSHEYTEYWNHICDLIHMRYHARAAGILDTEEVQLRALHSMASGLHSMAEEYKLSSMSASFDENADYGMFSNAYTLSQGSSRSYSRTVPQVYKPDIRKLAFNPTSSSGRSCSLKSMLAPTISARASTANAAKSNPNFTRWQHSQRLSHLPTSPDTKPYPAILVTLPYLSRRIREHYMHCTKAIGGSDDPALITTADMTPHKDLLGQILGLSFVTEFRNVHGYKHLTSSHNMLYTPGLDSLWMGVLPDASNSQSSIPTPVVFVVLDLFEMNQAANRDLSHIKTSNYTLFDSPVFTSIMLELEEKANLSIVGFMHGTELSIRSVKALKTAHSSFSHAKSDVKSEYLTDIPELSHYLVQFKECKEHQMHSDYDSHGDYDHAMMSSTMTCGEVNTRSQTSSCHFQTQCKLLSVRSTLNGSWIGPAIAQAEYNE